MTHDTFDILPPAPPGKLAQLLDVDAVPRWRDEDAAAALRHQLAAHLLPDLAGAPGLSAERLQELLPSSTTFLSALLTPTPIEILHAVKLWSRQLRADPASPLSPGPATVLYYAAVAAAFLHHAERITQLSDMQLREGFAWSLAQAGAESLGPLFRSALASR